MSIIVSVKINDGIVLAADSATTFAIGQAYEHAEKIVNLVKGLPLGVMTCGSGGIGNASIVTLLKDLRSRLSGKDNTRIEWKLDPDNYTMEEVTRRVDEFLQEKAHEADFKWFLLLRICGYSSGKALPEVWQVALLDNAVRHEPNCIQPEDDFGLRWNGEQEALDRLIIGIGSISDDGLKAVGMTGEQMQKARDILAPHTYENLILPAAPIQDAIELAKFLVETTKGFIRFAVKRAKTVGGPIEIAAITKHEGFKWIQRKHFYPYELNRPA